jgi:hypothetical protein
MADPDSQASSSDVAMFIFTIGRNDKEVDYVSLERKSTNNG